MLFSNYIGHSLVSIYFFEIDLRARDLILLE